MKKMLGLFTSLTLLCSMAACTPSGGPAADPSPADTTAGDDSTPAAPSADGVFRVGYCINNFNDTFQTYIVDEVQAYIDGKDNLELITADAQEDVIRQQDEVNNLINKGVDALIVVPVDTSAMDPITKAAADAGIPLCYVNRNPYGEGQDVPANVYYVGSQEITAGEMQMEYIGGLMGGEGGICILQGILSNEGAVKRTEGNEQYAAANFPGITVLAKETAEWQRDLAIDKVQNWVSAYGDDLKAVLANNDEMALGAVRALEQAGREDVLVIGIDGIPDAIQAIEEGKLAGSVLQDAAGQGVGAITLIETVLGGGTADEINWVDFQLITPDNVQNYK